MRFSFRPLAASLISFSVLGAVPVWAACAPDSLGTKRTIVLDPAKHSYFEGDERSLGLRKKEVILTFDDGPFPGVTNRILDTLSDQCAKATFFTVGNMARAYPKLLKRIASRGHTLAHHTHNHNRLPEYKPETAGSLIDRGIATVQKIAYGDASSVPRTPFFRYPYLDSNAATDRLIKRKGLIAFGTNIDSLDWKKESSDTVHDRIMRRVRKQGRGIILMHDIQPRTAKMLPRLLRSLKAEGFNIVHMVAPTREPVDDDIVVASLPDLQPAGKPKLPGSEAGDRTGDPRLEAVARFSPPVVVTIRKPEVTGSENLSSSGAARSGVTVSKRPSRKSVSSSIVDLGESSASISKEPAKVKTTGSVSTKQSRKQKVAEISRKARGWKLRRSHWIIQ